MARTLILACGNPLRGDDAVGWQIAKALKSDSPWPEIEVEAAHQLVPEMAEGISQADIVIFVDASAAHSPGSVIFERVVPSRLAPETFTHELNPQILLALADALYGRSPARAFTLVVGAESFELNEELSESVRNSIPEAVCTILGYLARQAALPARLIPTLTA
ncbi:MAG: hydrogenase maturation protease [Candidatus Acidiferrales bacterium]